MRKKQKISKVKRIGTCLVACIMIAAMTITSVPLFQTEVRAAGVSNPWDGSSREVPETDEDGTYLIHNGAQLAWFADQVNSGNGEINARLEDYIYLNKYNTSHKWVIIGDSQEHPYKGTFDGNGQKIVYMNVEINGNMPEKRYAGLFGVIDGGSVRNLTVLGKVMSNYASYTTDGANDQFYSGSGGVAGYLKNGSIVNCVNYTRTTMEGDALYRNAGGIAGISEGVISRCENYGKISTTVVIAQNHVGGIVGLVSGANAEVTTSVNHANVQGYYCVGGIAGAVKAGAEVHLSANYGDVKGNGIIGGVAGRVSTTGMYSNGTAKECAVYDVYNLGLVSGYGTTAGSEMGGIVGEAGYENWKQEALPPMPVIERAYSVPISSGVARNGGIIGYLLSGCYGTVYAISSSSYGPNVVGATNNRAVKILGEARKVTEDEMKSEVVLEKLGSAFTASNAYDTENKGYPKLAWQSLPTELLDRIDAAQLELSGWLTENNRKKYGKNYVQIESLVKTYKEKLSAVASEEELDQVMKEAREKLTAIKPGVGQDTDLADAIDNGIIALEEYHKRLVKENPDLTDDQKLQLENVLTAWKEKLETAESEDDVRLLVRDGKDALEDEIASFTADKKLEEVRANAVQVLTDYRASETYDVVWMHKIKLVRDGFISDLQKAQTVAELNKLLEQAKNEIDAIIDQIPETGAWDGVTKTEPKADENGVYQITSGDELAWFADQVNQGKGSLNAVLCNDISLGGKYWTPIGKSADKTFSGTFDGQGHVIRGLYQDVESDFTGLFGAVRGAGASVSHLTVSGNIKLGGRVTYVAGIAGYVAGKNSDAKAQITDCHSKVSITVTGIRTLDAGVAGVAGYSTNAKITNCSNEATVEIVSAGRGGLTYYAGGIVGVARTGCQIEACTNKGTVWSAHAAGGLIGGILTSDVSCRSSYNAGDISGLYYAGGICGVMLNDTAEFNRCYTSGTVNAKDSGLALGALFGRITGSKEMILFALKRADNIGRTLVGSSGDFSACGKFVSEKELKSDDMLNNLNAGGNQYIHDYLGFQNGYPILAWEMTLEDFQAGSISSLNSSVSEADYTAENWKQVQKILADAADRIHQAADMEAVDAIRTETQTALKAIETLAGAQERKLQEAKEEAINLLENYVDLESYRDEEKSAIQSLIANAKKYILLADTIAEVERHSSETRSKIDRIPDAWQYEHQLDMAAATQVDSYIMNIGEVIYTPYVKMSIQIARTAYDSLTERQKNMVTAYQILLDAEKQWEILEAENSYTDEDLALAAEVDKLIDAIGSVTEDSGEAIEKARYAYDSLPEKIKTIVSHPEVLIQAEQTYNQLKASKVVAAIAGIGEVTLEKKEQIFAVQAQYETLTEIQKKLVTDYNVLVQAIRRYQNLVVVQPVIRQIHELGGVESITLESGTAIMAAINMYNALTGEQQELVTNYDVLEMLIRVYDSKAAIDRVTRLIDSIGAVSSASGSQIQEARAAYDALTLDEQKQIRNLSVLEHAEAAYAALTQNGANARPGTGEGNQETLESLRNGGNTFGLSDLAQNGQNLTGEVAGTIEGVLPEEADDAQVQDQTQIPVEDTQLPDWLASQLDEGAAEDSTAVKATGRDGTYRILLSVLVIVFTTCGILTIGFAVALAEAAKKRKATQVHY